MKYQLSLIIPVYKTERFIEKCLLSVCNQTLEKFQIIIIDDCSPDGSLEVAKKVLQRYPDREKHTKIISFNINQGISNVRKYALGIANGDYISSLDSDDYLEPDALEIMLAYACKFSADIIFSDYFVNTERSEKLIRQEPIGDKINIIKQILEDDLHGSLCNKLFKREVLNKVTILDNVNMSEDLLISIQAIYFSENIFYVPRAFLHYVKSNDTSYTTIFSEKKIADMVNGIVFLDDFFLKTGTDAQLNNSIIYRKIVIKSDALTHLSGNDRYKYNQVFKNELIGATIDKKLSFYKKIIFFISKKNYLFILPPLIFFRNIFLKIKGN